MVAGVSADFGLQDKFEVHAILETLKVDKLIVRHGPELWRFRHTTHQEVAYGRILLAQRYDFHLSIAKKLQKVFGDNGTGSQAGDFAVMFTLLDLCLYLTTCFSLLFNCYCCKLYFVVD